MILSQGTRTVYARICCIWLAGQSDCVCGKYVVFGVFFVLGGGDPEVLFGLLIGAS